MCCHLQKAGTVKITKNGGGKILGCLKMGPINAVVKKNSDKNMGAVKFGKTGGGEVIIKNGGGENLNLKIGSDTYVWPDI